MACGVRKFGHGAFAREILLGGGRVRRTGPGDVEEPGRLKAVDGHAGANGDLIPTTWSVVTPTDASKRSPSPKAPAASRCSRVVRLHPV